MGQFCLSRSALSGQASYNSPTLQIQFCIAANNCTLAALSARYRDESSGMMLAEFELGDVLEQCTLSLGWILNFANCPEACVIDSQA